MKRVPETDQPSSSDDSHQEPTENFTPHASDHGESAENAEHSGGESVRRIGKYLLSIQPRPGLKRTGYQTAQDKKHAKRPQRLPGLPSAPEGIGAGRRSVKGYGRTQHAGPQAGNASDGPGASFPSAPPGKKLPAHIRKEKQPDATLKNPA